MISDPKLTYLRLAGAACLGLLLLAPPARGADATPAAPTSEQIEFFEKKVRPVLVESCFKCHGGEEKIKGGLRMTSRAALLKGGDAGPGIALDAPAKSLILQAISYTRDELQMPPKGKLPPEQIAILTKWVEMGAPFAPGSEGAEVAAAAAPAGHGPPEVNEQTKSFWSFVPVKRPAAPAVRKAEWVRNPVDAFVLAKLEEKNLSPAPPAEKGVLLRRAYYDLVGLPPTPAEVEAFVNDSAPDAYEKVVERLLASPQYGEKWGRHWLDLVRFAETNSYERDGAKPNAWRYRDYVIRSFNDDKPYDRFIKEQLAGDEMPGADANPDLLVATGYYRLGIWDDDPADRPQARADELDDLVATTSQVFLGLTVDCARCHDHKIDPIPQRDYYKLLSFFQNVTPYRNGGATDERPIASRQVDREALEQRLKEWRSRRKAVEAAIYELEVNFRHILSGEPGRGEVDVAEAKRLIRTLGERVIGKEAFAKYKELKRESKQLEKAPADIDVALCVSEAGPKAPETFVMIRGNAHVPGAKVEPGFLEVLAGSGPAYKEPTPGAKTTNRRTVLAGWIASDQNPLTARVMANRIWQHHFGRGIVRSSSNFGFQGDRPTHPELLDWLAAEFVGQGWRLKAMHRLLMTSSAYRMSSAASPEALALDPQNNLLWRFDPRRLTAEEIRDSVLAVNGTLNRQMFGPGVYPPIPAQVLAGQSRPGEGWGTSTPEEAARRSIYVHAKRSLRVPLLESFDAAEVDKTCPVRFVTVQPTQALSMLNGSFMNDAAGRFAERLRREAGAEDTRAQVAAALRLATCRPPSDAEIARGVELIQSLREKDGTSPEVALKYFCLVALNLNEFLYLD